MTRNMKLAEGLGATERKREAVPLRLRLLVLLLVVGVGLTAYAFQKKGGGGSTGPLYLDAGLRDSATDKITSDIGTIYRHGLDGQVTLGKPGAGRFRLDLGKLNPNLRAINIDLSACGADCDNLNGPEVQFLQSGSEFIPQRDGLGNIIGWTTSGDTALDIRSMTIASGERYAHFYAHLTADANGFSRRVNFSRPEHVHEVWQCNDQRAEPAKVVCTTENGGSCVRWEVSGRNGCYRKSLDSLNRNWSTVFLEDFGFQVTLVPAP